jgi:hypothetical protein
MFFKKNWPVYARQPVNQENDRIENLLIIIKIPWLSLHLPEITRK